MPLQRGFTLIELMVTLAVAAILVAAAIPGFQSIVNSNRLAGASNELVAGLQTARMEAIRRGRRAVVCASANANAGASATCATTNLDGWIAFVDNSDPANNTFDSVGDTLLRNSVLDGPVLVDGEASVVYRGDGLARESDGSTLMTDGHIRIRIDTNHPATNVRCVDITTGGASVRTPEAHDASC
jgi:type IV fimbrial biogenesis protein FimT